MTQLVILGLISFWSGVYGIDANLVESVARHESALNPNAVGQLGEIGLMQLRPEFVKGYTRTQLFDPQTNIIVGIQKLKEAKKNCVHQNDIEWLICYNYGTTNAKKVVHPKLFPYIKNMKRLMVVKN